MDNLNDQEEQNSELTISKTKRKEHMQDLQDLGIVLVKSSKEKLDKLDLPQNLLEAIKLAQKITSNGALRRQYQYIGKLMRTVDDNEIRSKLEYLNGDSVKSTKIFHLAEKWRDQLLGDDQALDKFINSYSGFDIGEFRSLLRQVKKERQLNQNRNFTKLFRLIRSIIEENDQ